MEFLTVLWLPILLSSVFVFIASSIIHMALPLHKGDLKQLPGEERLLASMRDQGVQPGDYMFPYPPSMKEMSSPEMMVKYRQGPVGTITVMPTAPPPIVKNLAQWFVYSLVVGVLVAYVAMHGLGRGAHYLQVFRITGTVAIIAHGVSYIPDSIWKGSGWGRTFRFVFDGIVYGLVTAATFGWLWPQGV